jgi:hypothetical protein
MARELSQFSLEGGLSASVLWLDRHISERNVNAEPIGPVTGITKTCDWTHCRRLRDPLLF